MEGELAGEIDQAHLSYLHSRVDEGVVFTNKIDRWRALDKHPRFHVQDTDWGIMIGASRNAEPETYYWRFTQYIFPYFTMIGPYGEDPFRESRAWVPMDDETVMVIAAAYKPTRPLDERELEIHRRGGTEGGASAGFVGEGNFLPPSPEPGGSWWPKAREEEMFGYDYELQRTKVYSGIPDYIWSQDAAMQVGMGKIYDRSKEHLGTSDMGVIRMRHRMLEQAKRLSDDSGYAPPGVLDPEIYQVRAAAAELPRDADWLAASEELVKVVPGVNQPRP